MTRNKEQISEHGTDEVDIANSSFAELPSDWQKKNLEAARVVINLVYDKIVAGEEITEDDMNKMTATIHEEWLKRNSWVYDPNTGNPELAVPYEKLDPEEQAKDIAQLKPAIKKVQDYLNSLINIDDICT